MKVNVLPAALLMVPDPGFLHRGGGRVPLGGGQLDEPDVADDCDRGDLADMWRTDCGLSNRPVGTAGKIKFVKWHTFHEVADGLGFKSRQRVVAEFLIPRPISIVYRIEQVLGHFEKLLIRDGMGLEWGRHE